MGTGIYLKRFSGTITAVIIFALLLAGIFLFRGEEEKESVRKVFPSLQSEDVISIMLKTPGAEINLDLEDDVWIVTVRGEKARADQVAVERFIEEVKSLELIQTVSAEGKQLSEFGLQEPPSEFMLISDKADYYLLVGAKNPSGTGNYIYDIDKERVMITRSDAATSLTAHAGSDFKDRKVIAISPPLVKRIVLRVGNFFTVLEKKEGLWAAEPMPEGLTFDQSKAEELLSTLSDIEINDIVSSEPDNPEEYGFDLPSAEIEIFQNGGSYTLFFGKRRNEDEHYVKFDKDPAIYSTSKENFRKLPKNAEDIAQ